MNTLIILCHPEPTSFNGALTQRAVATLSRLGYPCEVHDLHASGFDPVEGPEHYREREDAECFSPLAEQRHAGESNSLAPEIQREIARLQWADLVIFQFPLWWHAQPAMLKGWLDRVFVSGQLYSSSKRYDRGHFLGKRAICSVTTGAPAESMVHNSRGGDINALLWPMHYSLYYMGFSVLNPFLAHGIQGHGFTYQPHDVFKTQINAHLASWAARLTELDTDEPMHFPGWADWDENGVLKPRVKHP